MTTRLLAFDWFNTLGRVEGFCTRDELRSYADQIERNKTDWQPFELPKRFPESRIAHRHPEDDIYPDGADITPQVREAAVGVAL